MKEKKKKKSILKRLMPYGGKKRGLLYVAMVLSAISGVAVLMPMVFIHRIVRNLILSTYIRCAQKILIGVTKSTRC